MDIFEKHQALQQIIKEAQVHIMALREECPHEMGTYIYKGNSGNWCESDDSYWKELTCTNCGRKWIEDHKLDGKRNQAYHSNPKGDWKEVRL